jgi:DNA-damage-inducible protein D
MSRFCAQKKTADAVEYWCARDLMKLLRQERWESFDDVVSVAKIECSKSGEEIAAHFKSVGQMVFLDCDNRPDVIIDILLTRYACYLISINCMTRNGDERSSSIKFAQAFFAIQSPDIDTVRIQLELIERILVRRQLCGYEKELSTLIYQRGVDRQGFARIRSRGDEALFNCTTADMKRQYEVPEGRPLADFLPTITIAAKSFATEITNHNIRQKDIYKEGPITEEHVKNNKRVRTVLLESGVKPEELPPPPKKIW